MGTQRTASPRLAGANLETRSTPSARSFVSPWVFVFLLTPTPWRHWSTGRSGTRLILPLRHESRYFGHSPHSLRLLPTHSVTLMSMGYSAILEKSCSGVRAFRRETRLCYVHICLRGRSVGRRGPHVFVPKHAASAPSGQMSLGERRYSFSLFSTCFLSTLSKSERTLTGDASSSEKGRR